MGQAVVNKISEIEAKAIEKGVSILVNSRYGQQTERGSRIFAGKTHTFKQAGNNTIISRNADKAKVYQNGAFTQKATRQDKGAIAALPAKAQSLENKHTQQKTPAKARGR